MSSPLNHAKIHVMQLIAALEFGGAERLAATICFSLPKDIFKTSVCGFMGKEGPLVEDLRRNAILHFFLDSARISKLTLFRNLYRLLSEQQVDILQIHGAYTLLHCFLPAKLAGVKIVYTEHAKQTISQHHLASMAARFFPYGTAKVVCVSENLRAFFRNVLNVPDALIQVIHNGIDTDRFENDSAPFMSSRPDKVIGCVARLTEAKDHANLLEAFNKVVSKKSGVHLLLVGDGELRDKIEMNIRSLGLQEKVTMLGGRDDIPELLSGTDIFVLPSKREGFPVSILEAMAAGRPVVATDVGGVSEVITSGVNGIIVPPGNPEALANAILALMEDPDKAQNMATKGYDTVRTQFSVGKMIESYKSLFESIIT